MSAYPDVMDTLVSLAKRRGFIFQSSEIYGGTGSVWDYGPLGVELKNNVKARWWQTMVRERDDVEGLDAAILMHPKVWEASGHVSGFSDPLVDCKACKARFRADKIQDTACPRKPSKKPGEHGDCQLTEPRQFNLMFKTFMGPVEDSAAVVYLRPETAQGIFVNFLNVQQATRQKVPFGIAQIGKAFRNEITPGNFTFRTREFEQMEMQFFCKPGSDERFFEEWREVRWNWWRSLGMAEDKLRFKPHEKLAHYAKAAGDIEFLFPFGFGEVEGIHNRTDFDLTRHTEYSGKSLQVHDEETKEKYTPFVVETAAGASRGFMAFLCNAYDEETVGGEQRVVMHLHPKLAPIKVAVLPLVNKDGMPELATALEADLRRSMKTFYDDSGAVGRRYRRQDEIGTPFCVTIDSETLTDQTVTIRERDSMEQIRLPMANVRAYVAERLLA